MSTYTCWCKSRKVNLKTDKKLQYIHTMQNKYFFGKGENISFAYNVRV